MTFLRCAAAFGTAVCALLVSIMAPAAVEDPGCDALQQWAAQHASAATFEPRPGLTLNSLFEDARVVPLFASPVLVWSREDVSSIQGWLFNCRRKVLAAGNTQAGTKLSVAMKAVKEAGRALRSLWRARRQLDQQVEQLLRLNESPALPEILAIGEAALRGEAVEARVSALDRRWMGYARQAAQLGEYRDMLSAEAIVQHIAQLEKRRNAVTAELAARNEQHAALLAEIAAVPVSQAGRVMLDRIAYRTDRSAMTRQALESYNGALQQKYQQIQAALAAQQARAEFERATLPAPVREQVAAVLQGDRVAQVSIGGLQPGPAYEQIRAAAERQWGYAEVLYLGEADKQLSTKRREFNRLMETERRDGGLLNLRTRKGRVGELVYVEHFPGPLEVAPLKADLVERFGKPDELVHHPDGSLAMTWRDGQHLLRVRAGNRVTQDRVHMGVRSSVAIALWTQDFANYLAAAAERCRKLRERPVSELSVNDRQAILTRCLTP